MDDMTIESRLILAKYEDIANEYHARVNNIGEDFAQEVKAREAEAAERDRIQAEMKPAIVAEKVASEQAYLREQAEKEKNSTWEPREAKPKVLSFGGEELDDESAPPPPPAPQARRPRPAPSRPVAVEEEEEDDWSGRSWVR
ncbi:hypothetical protein [Actinokineospora xionganensis]|uniref:Uncharacterized protein n=1 Tax=Actinokineospora xionganensis TaxID=2684470 RepID=A0ABR7L1E4_9PSEU|nr:hypothetical protein [Actinokineospora xionganensis]MBC6446313.1 hypothetical protein [Actinokineospora xionganensis]